LGGVLDDGDDSLELFGGEFTSTIIELLVSCSSSILGFGDDLPLVEVDIGLLADQVGVAATNTLYLGQGVHDLLLSLDIGVEETENKLEVRLLPRN
jgi:hypothetical protein